MADARISDIHAVVYTKVLWSTVDTSLIFLLQNQKSSDILKFLKCSDNIKKLCGVELSPQNVTFISFIYFCCEITHEA